MSWLVAVLTAMHTYVRLDHLYSLNSCQCCRRWFCLVAFCTWLLRTWTALPGCSTWRKTFGLKLHYHHNDRPGRANLDSDREFDFPGLFKGFLFRYKLRKPCRCQSLVSNHSHRQAYGHKVKPSSPRSTRSFALLSGTLYRFSKRQPLIRAASFAHLSAWRQVLHGMD